MRQKQDLKAVYLSQIPDKVSLIWAIRLLSLSCHPLECPPKDARHRHLIKDGIVIIHWGQVIIVLPLEQLTRIKAWVIVSNLSNLIAILRTLTIHINIISDITQGLRVINHHLLSDITGEGHHLIPSSLALPSIIPSHNLGKVRLNRQ